MYKYVIALTQGCSDSFEDFVDFSIRINISIAACFGVDELSINGNLKCHFVPSMDKVRAKRTVRSGLIEDTNLTSSFPLVSGVGSPTISRSPSSAENSSEI